MPAVEGQEEYQRLRALGLHLRPQGCFLGIHPACGVWRAGVSAEVHFSRSFGKSRSSWQALLRCMELMLESYLNSGIGEDRKHVKHQLLRIRKLRSEEPPHKD